MNPKYEVPMDVFNRMTRAQQIQTLCRFHECNDKIAEIHHDQYVHRNWNPHPPKRFLDWVFTHPDYVEMLDYGTTGREVAVKMFNCQSYRDQYVEAKQVGVI